MTANQENITNYLTKVITTLQTGSAREHAYRPAIHELFEKIKPELNAVNDPARSEHGAPDFIFFKNEKQYFGNVPEIAWNFFIGGYQPAQKWLKDRKGQTLSNKDLEHWQKIIVSLFDTDKIMKEIDEINFF